MVKILDEFDATNYLTDDEAQYLYLEESLKSGDKAEFIQALNTVARARGIAQIAQETGLGRESLYKTLSGNVEPKLSTLERIASALGYNLSLTLTPKKPLNSTANWKPISKTH